jgi:hypothetical protein
VSGAPAVRRAPEKRRRPSGGRWGRVEGVPLSVYYELDDLRTQIDGLSTLAGMNRQELYALLDLKDAKTVEELQEAQQVTGVSAVLKGKRLIEATERTRLAVPIHADYQSTSWTYPIVFGRESQIQGVEFALGVDPAGGDYPYSIGAFSLQQLLPNPNPALGLTFQTVVGPVDFLAPGVREGQWENVSLGDAPWPSTKWFEPGVQFQGVFVQSSSSNALISMRMRIVEKRILVIQ